MDNMVSVNLRTLDFCGITLVNMTRDEFAAFAVSKSKDMAAKIAFSLNGESLAKYHNDKNFQKLFDHADYVHADGMSIVSFSRLLPGPGLPERIATTDWFHDVAKISEKQQVSHYFLGADADTLNLAIRNVKNQYPDLNIVGAHNGYFSDEDLEYIIDEINLVKPNFIWLSLGRPKQEITAIKLQERCQIGMIKTCGGLFDFLSGNNRRAPVVMQRVGLEWLFRLYLQPKRLFRRYLVTNYQSIIIVLSEIFRKKATNR